MHSTAAEDPSKPSSSALESVRPKDDPVSIPLIPMAPASGTGSTDERQVSIIKEPSVKPQPSCVTPPSPSPSPKPTRLAVHQEPLMIENAEAAIVSPKNDNISMAQSNQGWNMDDDSNKINNINSGNDRTDHNDHSTTEVAKDSPAVKGLASDLDTSRSLPALGSSENSFPPLLPTHSGEGSSGVEEQGSKISNLEHKQQGGETLDTITKTTERLGDQGQSVRPQSAAAVAVPHRLFTRPIATAFSPGYEKDHYHQNAYPSPHPLHDNDEYQIHSVQVLDSDMTVLTDTATIASTTEGDEGLVAQTKQILPPKTPSTPTRQELHYRKSTALPPLNTTTVATLTQQQQQQHHHHHHHHPNQQQSASSTTTTTITALSDVNTSLPNSTATTSTTTTPEPSGRSMGVMRPSSGRAPSSYYSSPLPSLPSLLMADNPSLLAASALDQDQSPNTSLQSVSIHNVNIINSPVVSDNINSINNNNNNPTFTSAASTFASASVSVSVSTCSSPTDELASSSWILPPIPDFSELGLSFDKSRTSSANSMKHRHNNSRTPTQVHGHGHGTTSHESTPTVRQEMFLTSAGPTSRHYQQQHNQRHLQFQFQQQGLSGAVYSRSIPDFNPSVFDFIQADDNETYILWSSSNPDAPGSGNGGSSTPVPSMSLPQTQQHQTNMPLSDPYGSTSTSTGAAKRWSAGESFVGKDKAKDVQLHETSSVPSSPTASRGSHSQPPNAFKAGGTGSTGGGGGGQSSRGNTGAFNTAGSGQQVLLPENRVLMAATVEKLVEKLTSDIDYTFLTDFFLIYRSFISPLALLKLLMARFRWALMEDSPQRQIVRVRTFVTLRHWLLNYFEFDFTGSRLLRRTLTRGLRDLTSHPIVLSSVRDKRIVEDLRKHFQKKRRAHCRGMAQMALERSQEAVQSDTGVAVRRSVRHPRTTNLDWTDCRTSSKRSSLESGRIKSRRQTYFSGAKDDSMIEYNATGLSHVVTNNNEKAEEEDDDGSSSGDSSGLDSTDSQSEDDLYEEESHYLIHGGQQTPASNRRAPSGNDSGDDDVSENDSVDEDSMSGSLLARKQQQLPSPAFSSRSGGSNVGVLQDPYWYQQSPTGVMDYTQVSSHTTEIMEVQSHHRSNTVPRGGNMRSSNARPLSYTAMGSTSSVVLSPPESPRPLEPYINPPPPRNTLLSADKKKTWSQYMIATVEQLSKVKRVFMPRSSQSIHDLRRNASSTSSQSLVVGGKRGGRTGSSKSKKLEKSKGSMNSRYWQEDRIEKHGHKVSHSTTILDSMTGTNSVVSSADGQPAPSYEDVSVRHLEHTRSNGASEWSSDEDERTVDLMLRGIHPYSPGSRQVTEALFQPRRYAEESRSEYSKSLGKAAVEQAKYQKSQTIDDERDELNEESQTGGPTGASNLTPGRMPILRRTTQKRDKDHRASWMTFSSTGSSGFGAILSQGHIPPGQAIVRDRNELGNVDRFMERFYKSQQQQQQPQSYSSASPSPIDNRNNDTSDSLNNNCSSNIFSPVKGGRRKSMDAFHENQLRQASLSARGASISGQNLGQSNSRIGNNARSWMSRTLASHPHRQTVPIMNHNYLQEKLNEEMLEEYRPIRRHSSDVRNLEGWPTMMRTKEHKTFFGAHPLKGPRPPPVHNNNIHTHGNNHHHSTDTNHSIITDSHTQSNNNGSIFGSDYVRNQSQNRYHPLAPIPDPVQTCLLEGEAYKAALEESQRKGQALLQSSGARTVSQTHAHSFSSPLTFLLPDSMMGQDPTPGPGFDKSRSNSDPHLLQATAAMMSMSSPNGESDVYTYATRSSPQPGHSRIGGIGPLGGNYRSLSQQQQYTRHQSIVYPPYQYHSHHSHLDNSYSQQRSPMNPRFQSIISPTRDLMAPRPVPSSIVLRYRSEMIAQQMCLIEREQLFRVQWHELLKDGWKKKAPTTPTAEDGPLPTSDNSANSVSGHQPEPSSAGEPSYPVAGTTTVGDESPNVILLVDRFNLTCNWVTSEILKTTDLEMRVRVVEKFIRIAYTCYNHSNFSSLTQVMLGLQAHEVSRLSRTWARVGSHGMKIMQELVEFTTMLRNWKNLRDAMQDIIDQWGDTSSGSAAAVAIAATSTSAPASMGRTGLGGENQSITVATVPTTASATSVPTNRQSQLGLFSKKSSTVKDKSSKNGTAVHSKSVSGPVFPSLMSSLSKDKERERQQHILLQQQTQQQQHQLHHHPSLQYGLNTENNEKDKEGKKGIQQQHKGCIPVLAVYLSDLSFNNELPSFIEPKRPLSVSTSEYSSIQSPGPLSQSESMSTAVFLESTIAATVTPTPPASGHHPHPHHHQYNSSTTTASTMTTDITAGGASTTSGSTVSTPTASGYNIAASSVAVPHPPCSVPTSSAPAESLYPLMVHQGMVNMHKHRTIATIIKRILTFKAMANRYPFRKENEVFDWLMAIEAVDPSDWQRMSEICEEKQQPLQHQSQQQYQHQQPPQEQQQRQNQPSIISISTTIAASTVSTAAMTTVLPSSPPTSAASAPPMMMTAPIILPSAENNTRFA